MYHITTLSLHRSPALKRPEIHFPTNKQQNHLTYSVCVAIAVIIVIGIIN